MGIRKRISERTVHCQYCGILCIGTATRDHVYPKSLGGSSGKKNIVYACRRCNQAKGTLTREEFKNTDYYQLNCRSGRWRGVRLEADNRSSVERLRR